MYSLPPDVSVAAPNYSYGKCCNFVLFFSDDEFDSRKNRKRKEEEKARKKALNSTLLQELRGDLLCLSICYFYAVLKVCDHCDAIPLLH